MFKLLDYCQINFKLAWYYHQLLSKLVEYNKLYTHQETWELHALRLLNSCQEPEGNNHLIDPEPTCYIFEGVAKSSTGTRPTGTTENTGSPYMYKNMQKLSLEIFQPKNQRTMSAKWE